MKIPDLLIEQLLLDELPPAKAAEVRRRLKEAGQLDRLDALRADNAAILAEYPPRMVAAHVSVAARPQPRRMWLAVPALAAAAMALIAVLPGSQLTGDIPGIDYATGDYHGIKGDFLSLHRDGSETPLADGAIVRPGDLVQVSYNLPDAALVHGGIFSIDGNGMVTRHHVGPMDPSGAHVLPSSFQLDDAPDFERFLLIADDTPIDAAHYERALRRGEPIEAPEGGLLDTFTLNKE